MEYDPRAISYEQLLDVFWKSHDPTKKSWSRQYQAALFYHNEKQRELAVASRDREAARLKRQIATEILPATDFYPAEDYHQKYGLRQERDLMREFRAMYPREEGFVNSTAAARVNGFLSGYGTSADLESQAAGLGLSPAAIARLREKVSGSSRR